mgnify:CR=1 FL=1
MEKLGVRNAIFDGEIVALDKKGHSNFQLLQNSIKSKSDAHLRYYIFDLLYLNGEDLRELPLIERKEKLKDILRKSSSQILYSEHIEGEGEDFFKASCQHELEGMVSKLKDAPYISGRSDLWVKTKCQMRQEFVIGGYTEPRGNRSGIGALLLGVWEGKKFRYAGKVGTGFNHKMLMELRKTLDKKKAKANPFMINAPKNGVWVKPELVAEVSFSNWTDDGVLRTPVFISLRSDKPAKEIVMEEAISSPDKVLFAKEKITKEMIMDYYKAVSKWMLPHMKERLLSLVRCPNGTSKTCFFQKHFTGNVPKDFHVVTVKEEKGPGDYITVNSPEGLVQLVQLNAFEIHAWNCREDKIMNPDQIVMDLDPGEAVSWKEVVNSAFEMKKILENLGLKSFVKVTGGKGLHLHIPISPEYSWDDVKAFSHTLSLYLVEGRPDFYTANMSKSLRKKKIFIDYLRNGYGATAVAPYSLRAKEYSFVALPVTWEELKKLKGPQEFTLKKALSKLKRRRSDPWAGMDKLKQKIPILSQESRAA